MATLETMAIEERCKCLRLMRLRYRQAEREAVKRLLDEMQAFTGLHHKSLIGRLQGSLIQKSRARERAVSYGAEVDAALRVIWGATGLGIGAGHSRLAEGFLQAVLSDTWSTVGSATLSGRLSLAATGQYLNLLDTFTLLGDPALRPDRTIAPWAGHTCHLS